jgi:alkylation response protein AidB-like acyl-CoA dehydrogenase
VNLLGLTLLAPTVMAFGTQRQKEEILRPILFNDIIWCQGFSEPEAGSDLAGLACRAEDHGDHWLVNGQKTWTTNVTYADRMFALCRTDPSSRRHAGISMILIDLHSDGVEVRPIAQLTGESGFGEVFFTDVAVPKEAVLGPPNEGWRVAMALLSSERGGSALGRYASFRVELEEIACLASGRERFGVSAELDPVLRQKFGALFAELELLRLHALHLLTQVELGADIDAEASVTKLQWSELHRDIGDLLFDVAELDGQLVGGELSRLQETALRARSGTIWGGTSQIQRNLVAERILGLPR